MAKVWKKWFEGVDLLQLKPTETAIATFIMRLT
jgi:hypothetical protein